MLPSTGSFRQAQGKRGRQGYSTVPFDKELRAGDKLTAGAACLIWPVPSGVEGPATSKQKGLLHYEAAFLCVDKNGRLPFDSGCIRSTLRSGLLDACSCLSPFELWPVSSEVERPATSKQKECPFDAAHGRSVPCSGLLDASSRRAPVECGLPRANKKLDHFIVEFFVRRVVEAAGVEPASGRLRPRGTTCLFRVICLPKRSHGQENYGMSPTESPP